MSELRGEDEPLAALIGNLPAECYPMSFEAFALDDTAGERPIFRTVAEDDDAVISIPVLGPCWARVTSGNGERIEVRDGHVTYTAAGS